MVELLFGLWGENPFFSLKPKLLVYGLVGKGGGSVDPTFPARSDGPYTSPIPSEARDGRVFGQKGGNVPRGSRSSPEGQDGRKDALENVVDDDGRGVELVNDNGRSDGSWTLSTN